MDHGSRFTDNDPTGLLHGRAVGGAIRMQTTASTKAVPSSCDLKCLLCERN